MVADTIQIARKAAQTAFEKYHYDGVADVSEWVKVKDKNGAISQREKIIVKDQPCHLSFENVTTVDQTTSAAHVTQTVKLFVAPDLNIKPGAKITVKQADITSVYMHSGKAAVYDTHQEIMLDLFERYA
jgi:hypothetical protein